MNGSFMIPDVMAVSTLFKTAEGLNNRMGTSISPISILAVKISVILKREKVL